MDKQKRINVYFVLAVRQIYRLEPMGDGVTLRYMGWSASGHQLVSIIQKLGFTSSSTV